VPRTLRPVNIPRPTRSAALLFAFAILLELLGRLVESTSITIAAAAALGAVIGDAALTPRIEGITYTRRASRRTTVGVPTRVQLELRQPDRRRTGMPPVLVNHDHPAELPTRVLTPAIRRGGQAVIQSVAVPQHRGYWEVGGTIQVEAHSPLGGFLRRGRSNTMTATPRWVYPAPALPIPLPDTGLGAPSDAAGASRSGGGLEFFGIREWRSGDSASNVHWRASARRNQLVVIDRERPAKAALIVLIGPATPGPGWELAISRGAATAVAARRAGRPVMLVCGQQHATPDSRNDVLDWFAELAETPPAEPGILTIALRQQGPGATVLWLATEALPPDIQRVARAATARVVSLSQQLVEP
jgi:uncharacterized protein (DUF58 family)